MWTQDDDNFTQSDKQRISISPVAAASQGSETDVSHMTPAGIHMRQVTAMGGGVEQNLITNQLPFAAATEVQFLK